MTRVRVNGVPVVEAEWPQACQDCGKNAETRPYGPGGIEVCFQCMMKDEAEAKRRFGAFIEGERISKGPQGGKEE